MKLRLFVAINLSTELKDKISAEVQKLSGLLQFPIRFLKPENWHLTISFLGYQEASAADTIMKAIRETAAETPPPQIVFESLSYGPRDLSSVRMIWLNGSKETAEKLTVLKNSLEDKLTVTRINFKRENRPFKAHLTLSRFKAQNKKNLPDIEKPFTYEFYPQTLDLMESRLKRSGAEYSVVSGFAFKNSL